MCIRDSLYGGIKQCYTKFPVHWECRTIIFTSVEYEMSSSNLTISGRKYLFTYTWISERHDSL